jgi:manganese-transporting P-type ATPase
VPHRPPGMAEARFDASKRSGAPQPSQPTWTGKAITSLTLYTRAPVYFRADALPFAALYAALLAVEVSGTLSRFTFLAALAALVTLHILTFLAQHWSVTVWTMLSWRRVRAFTPRLLDESNDPIHALIRPRVHRGKAELVRLERSSGGRVFFSFQKRTYEYNVNEHRFDKVQYPTKLPLSSYTGAARRTRGLSEEAVLQALERYGTNRLEIPLPNFRDLFQEALLAPFFVFQVFCVFLWMLDEHPFYSLMTLFMMLTFEATVVFSRLRSLRELRGMRNRPQTVHVFRGKKWTPVTSLDLLPGDVLSVPRSSDAEDVVPCDVLILAGTAVVNEAMLTGESVPMMKEALPEQLDAADVNRPLAMKTVDKNQVIFGGTRVLTHTPSGVTSATPATRPPDCGCICYVLRTGFGSSQGTLMRTILYSTESVSANSLEAALFIVFLLCFAIAASGFVLYHRYADDVDSRYKLLLRCVLIITSVVPPELPMQLSLAVNTSLLALAKGMVFCTEPFRIPYAGKVDICGFDKTGTLTTDIIQAAGVALPPGGKGQAACGANAGPVVAPGDEVSGAAEFPMVPVAAASTDAALVLAACHSLVHVDGGLIGDPLELASLSAAEWTYGSSGTAVPKRGGASSVSCTIVQRFRFASALQRMSVLAEVRGSAVKNGVRVLTKGSAEAIARLVGAGALPNGYHETAQGLARRGMRVLALAHRDVDSGMTASEVLKMPRAAAESNLKFAGFVCFECPLRPDSRRVVRMLKRSSHDVMMVTGDATLTAAHVARQVGISTRSVLILEPSEVTPGTLEWISAATGKRRKKFAASAIPDLADEYDLCVSGPALVLAMELDAMTLRYLRHVKVFARTSPNQKEVVLSALKDAGLYTLFCGDGTNDVGALKQAHIGVALLSGALASPPPGRRSAATTAVSNGAAGPAGGVQPPKSAGSILRQRRAGGAKAGGGGPHRSHRSPQDLQREEIARRVEELKESLGEGDDQAPLVKLGDASIASPFTSRRMTIESCVTIIRQGRCTLATTSQMYQILALNCLISAYSLSVLYLEGVVFGDRQMTITSLAMAVSFFMISRSKPLKKLSAERPPSSVFAPRLFLSLIGQFAVHLASLYFLTEIAREYIPYGPRNSIDAAFKPSVINTVIFLLSIAQQVNVFTVNYKGRPFMQGLTDNRMLLRSLLFVAGIVVFCTAEISPDVNELMELTPWPDASLQRSVGTYILVDFAAAWLWDKLMWLLFAPRKRARD